jgi:hypothetical protein
MYASDQVDKNGGSVDDYIPEYIRNEFINKTTIPIKSLSVEIDWGAYPKDNYEDMAGTLHIKKFDLIAVAFLTHSPPGQSQSLIKKDTVEIRTKSKNLNSKSMDINKSKIRCLCEFWKECVFQFTRFTNDRSDLGFECEHGWWNNYY